LLHPDIAVYYCDNYTCYLRRIWYNYKWCKSILRNRGEI
jgi:hypothetical protein